MNFEELNAAPINDSTSLFNLGNVSTKSESFMLDDTERNFAWVVTATANLTIFDEFIKSVISGGGSIITRVTSETVVVSDGLIKWVYRRRDLADAFAVLDNTGLMRQRITQLTEQLVVSDGLAFGRTLGRQSTEQLTTLDNMVNWRRRVVVSSDVLTLIDSLSAFAGRISTILATEPITLNDTGRTLEWAVTAEGTLTVIESFIKAIVRGSSIRTIVASENITLTDGVYYWVLRRRDVSEILELTEASGLFQEVATEDAIVMFDEFIKNIIRAGGSQIVVIGDNLTVTSDTGQSWTYRTRALTDALSIVEQVTQYRLRGRVIEDDLTVRDELIFMRRLVRTIDETVTLVDGLVKSVLGFGTTYTRILSESMVMQDLSGRAVFRTTIATEALLLNDTQLSWLRRIRLLTDSVDVQDGVVTVRVLRRDIAELLGLTDAIVSRYIPAQLFEVRIRIGARIGENILGMVNAIVLGTLQPNYVGGH
jgi:hypothetical protein